MSGYNMSPQEAHAANHLMSHAFVEWADAGKPHDYVDLARRLNAACIVAIRVAREARGRDSA